MVLAQEYDENITKAMGQYKPILVGYYYGLMVTIEKVLGKKVNLPGVKELRRQMRETRNSDLYKNLYK